jgi:S-adenosylmethionine synthetase
MMKPMILRSTCDPLADQPFEIVERKGLGHPDTICDAVMEQVAVQLAKAYLKICGRVLHFNTDKGLLVAGEVDCRPGGGHVITPMRLVMGDRATFEWRKKRVPVEEIPSGLPPHGSGSTFRTLIPSSTSRARWS